MDAAPFRYRDMVGQDRVLDILPFSASGFSIEEVAGKDKGWQSLHANLAEWRVINANKQLERMRAWVRVPKHMSKSRKQDDKKKILLRADEDNVIDYNQL